MMTLFTDQGAHKYWWRALGILAAISALLHLTSLSQPREVVFDEVHFGKFVSAYCCTHERFFDIHPPHAKLIIAGAARAAGYDGTFPFEHIGQPYTTQPVWALRLVPALVGTVLPLVIVVLLRQLGASALMSLVGGAVIVFDNALTLQTRIIALDGVLLVATFGAVSAYLAGEHRRGLVSWGYFILAGALAGLAAGTKFTGLAALALLGVMTLVALAQHRSGRESWQWVGRGAVMVAAALIVYALGWIMHYQLLYLPGSGDAWYVPTGNFFSDTRIWHQKMLSANYTLQATHPDASPWWSWPFMGQSVFYWQKMMGNNTAYLYFLGNPVVWWGTGGLCIAALAGGAIRFGRRVKEKSTMRAWIPLVGYGIAMLPLVRVPRALFLYHYATPLIFALLFGVLWLENVTVHQSALRRRCTIGILMLLVVGFVWFSPLTYGIAVPQEVQPFLFWFPGWR